MPLSIRQAALADEAAVLALMEELFEPPGQRPARYSLERGRQGFQYAVERPDADLLLALDGDTVVGLASVYVDFASIRLGWRCWLEDLVVAPSRRSGGVGRALLAAAVEWARERGCTHLKLDSSVDRKDAHRFYLAQGMAQDSLLFRREIE